MHSGPQKQCPEVGFPRRSDIMTYYCYVAVGGDEFNTWTYASYTDVFGNTYAGWIPDTELSYNPPNGNGSSIPGTPNRCSR